MYTEEEIKTANATSRGRGAVGKNAIVPKAVRYFLSLSRFPELCSVLDYGAGKTAEHARQLQSEGYHNVIAYEFGENFNPEYHHTLRPGEKFSMVYASNVLNVQSSEEMLRKTLKHLHSLTEEWLIVNFPKSPRKLSMTYEKFIEILGEYFEVMVHSDYKTVYFCVPKLEV